MTRRGGLTICLLAVSALLAGCSRLGVLGQATPPIAHVPAPPPKLAAPVPVAPANDVTLVAMGAPLTVRLVWTAAPLLAQERFFVQVLAPDSPGEPEIMGTYVDHTNAVVRLPAMTARYVWRVYAVPPGSARHYAPSAWNGFRVEVRDAGS